MMIFLAVVAAATIGAAPVGTAAAPPDGSYTYSINQSGSQIGTSTVTLKHTGSDISVHETETLGTLSFVIDEVLDATTLDPKTYVASYTKDTYTQTARGSFDRSGASISFDGVPGSQSFPFTDGSKNAYVLEQSLLTGFFMLPAQIHASRASQFMQVVPSQVLTLTSRINATTAGPRPAGLPAQAVPLSVGSKVNFDEWYDPGTFVLEAVSVPIQDVLIKLTK
jgi:hypothetical protein